MAQLLTLNEVAEHLRLSRRTVESLVATGELPSILVRRRRRVPATEVDEFINGKLALMSTATNDQITRPVIAPDTS
jgi:excisionase family DNA binding protein